MISKTLDCVLESKSNTFNFKLDTDIDFLKNYNNVELGRYLYENLWSECKNSFHRYGYPISILQLSNLTVKEVQSKKFNPIGKLELSSLDLYIQFYFKYNNSKRESVFLFKGFKPKCSSILPIALDKYLKSLNKFELNSKVELFNINELDVDILNKYTYWNNTKGDKFDNELSFAFYSNLYPHLKDEVLMFNCDIGNTNYNMLVTYIPNEDFNKLGFNIFTY